MPFLESAIFQKNGGKQIVASAIHWKFVLIATKSTLYCWNTDKDETFLDICRKSKLNLDWRAQKYKNFDFKVWHRLHICTLSSRR
jgi:hypothetical protein